MNPNSIQETETAGKIPEEKILKEKSSLFKDTLIFALIIFFVVVPIRTYIAKPFIVSGASMFPTFKDGEYLIVDEIHYRFDSPERFDVVIFKYPEDPSKYFIKRIIGLPNETVNIKDGSVTILNKEHPKGFTLQETYIKNPKKDALSFILHDNEYFVMGDNRLESYDSRYWGPVNRNLLVGRAFVRLLPLNQIDLFPGKATTAE